MWKRISQLFDLLRGQKTPVSDPLILFPPSLPGEVIKRAYRSASGELGILPMDAELFLTAADADGLKVIGWELWLIDHFWGPNDSEPVPAPGQWTGLIPTRDDTMPAVFTGDGGDQTSGEIAALNLDALLDPRWAPHVRFNFTLEADSS